SHDEGAVRRRREPVAGAGHPDGKDRRTVTARRTIVCGPASTAWIASGLLERAGDDLVSPSGRFLLVSSEGSAPVAERLRRTLSGRTLLDLTIDDREEAKTLDAVERIAQASLDVGIRRDDAFVAVGGGVVSDIVGFAAAIVLRGVAWNVIPTTTGAM